MKAHHNVGQVPVEYARLVESDSIFRKTRLIKFQLQEVIVVCASVLGPVFHTVAS